MATRTAKLYSGEDKTPIVDYTDYVIWEESEFGTRAHAGEGSSSTVVIRDPLGETGQFFNLPAGLTAKTLPAKSLFVIEVGSDMLFRGRIGIKNYSRDGQHVERYRQVEASLHDTNWDLDHITVHNYSRPSESDTARIQGLIASYLSASPRKTTALNGSNFISSSNTVTLVAQTYTRQTPLGILREISETANKQFFVTGDTIGGGSLFWDGNDSAAYTCTLSISDRESEVRASPSTVFPPIWNVGAASTEDGSELLSQVYLFYGTDQESFVTVTDDSTAAQYGFASRIFTDDTATTAAVAQARAQAIQNFHDEEDKTVNVTIGPLTDAQVVLIRHGQLINIKARAVTYADDQSFAMRIGQCRFTTPTVGQWFAHLQLGRPWKMAPYATGPVLIPKPPASGSTPSILSSDIRNTNSGGAGFNDFGGLSVPAGSTLVAFISNNGAVEASAVTYYPGGTGGIGATHALTQVEVDDLGADEAHVEAWILTDAVAHTGSSGLLRYQFDDALDKMVIGWAVLGGVTSYTSTSTQGVSAAPSLAVTAGSGDLVVDFLGWWQNVGTPTASTAGSGQTIIEQETLNAAAGQRDGEGAFSSKVGASSMSWAITSGSVTWGQLALIFAGDVADTTEPVGSAGDTGTDTGISAPIGHIHEGRTIVRKNSTGSDFIRRRVNLIEGTNVTLTVADDSANNEIDVTVAATSGALTVEDEGSALSTPATTLDFVGAGVTATGTGAEKTITIPGGAGLVGMDYFAAIEGFHVNGSLNSAPTAGRAYLMTVKVNAPMKLRGLKVEVITTGTGTYEWGLFDPSASATAATKLAGGTYVPSATGWNTQAATSAPVDIDPGVYALIWRAPSSGTLGTFRNTQARPLIAASMFDDIAWDDTPDLTGFNTVNVLVWLMALVGDFDGSGNQYPG